MLYFLQAPTRLAKEAYFSRLLDIIRRPEGAAVLQALSEVPAQMEAVLAAQPDPGEQAARPSKHGIPDLSRFAAVAAAYAASLLTRATASVSPGLDTEAIATAQLNCVHLVHAMVKLLPGWLPEPLFMAALQRWRSADFQSRCVVPALLMTCWELACIPDSALSSTYAGLHLRHSSHCHSVWKANGWPRSS